MMLMFQPQIMGFLIDFVEVKYFVDNCEAQGGEYMILNRLEKYLRTFLWLFWIAVQ